MAIKIEYNIEKEMKNNNKRVEKILKKFSGVGGLSEVLNRTLILLDSEIFISITKDEYILDNFNKIVSDVHLDDEEVSKRFPLLVNAEVLKQTKTRFLYIPSIMGDTIIYGHFDQLLVFLVYNLYLKKENTMPSIEELLSAMGKVMILMKNFDSNQPFAPPDKDYFLKLKSIKWDKNAEKLLEKILDIVINIMDLILKEPLSDHRQMNMTNVRFSLTFLAACNAVNNGREKMEIEDVIVAYNTYYKIIDS